MCLKFPCVAGDDDGTPASHLAAKPPNSHSVRTPPAAASGQLPSSAMNGAGSHPVHTPPAASGLLPSSATNGVSKPPAGATGGGYKLPPQEPEKFDFSKTEGGKKSEKVTQVAKADNKPSSPTEKPDKKDDGARNGGRDHADARARMNQDHSRLPCVDDVGSQANGGTINQDDERRASTNEPIREAADHRFPRADDVGSLANPIPRKDQPRRGARNY